MKSHKVVKIRKPHRCIVCTNDFSVGTEMHHVVDDLDGFKSTYTCDSCWSDNSNNNLEIDLGFKVNPEQIEAGFNYCNNPEDYLALKRAERQKLIK